MECTREEAIDYLNATKNGVCKHCNEIVTINKDGMLRKHGDCEQDYPWCGMLPDSTCENWIPMNLNALAEIAFSDTL